MVLFCDTNTISIQFSFIRAVNFNFLTNFVIVYQREVTYSYDRKCDKKRSINPQISSSFDCDD